MNHRHWLARASAFALSAGASLVAHAQDVSPVVAATLYTDGAVVERLLKTPGGTRHVQVDCLPPGFSDDSLEVDGDPSARVADIRTEVLGAEEAQACVHGPRDARLNGLEDQKAALDAQSRADDIALDYLRRWNGNGAAPASPHAGAPVAAGPAADGLRKSVLDLMNDQLRLKHQSADIDRQVAALRKADVKTGNGSWQTLRFDVSTAGAATLHLRYATQGAHWTPSYRAALDTATSTLRLDRQAEITQASGEDWADVALKLSLSRTNAEGAALPGPWNLTLIERPRAVSSSSPGTYGNDLQRIEVTGSSIRFVGERFGLPAASPEAAAPAIDRSPLVSLSADERTWDTLFRASQPVTLPADARTHTLALDSRTLPVTLHVQAQPQQAADAWLVADVPRPAGIWPAGELQLWRDGVLVASGANWPVDARDHMLLDFGHDDRVRVAVERPASMKMATGLFGSRTQRTWGTVYVVTNRHDKPQAIELVDAAPVSHDEGLKVASTYDPQPQESAWEHLNGVNAWRFTLTPGQSQRVNITHTVSWPSDADVRGLPTAR